MLTEEEPPPFHQPAAENAPVVNARHLRKFVKRHNQQALLLSFFSFVGAMICWGLLYAGIYWFTLVAATIQRGLNPATLNQITHKNLVEAQFSLHFVLGGITALFLTAFLRKKLDLERLRERRHYFLWIAAELFMAVPNVTFSIWGNLSALCRLRRGEAEQASQLLQRMEEAEGRLSMASLPLEIQDERRLGRVLFVLQIVGLVSVREKTEGWFLYLENRNMRSLRMV